MLTLSTENPDFDDVPDPPRGLVEAVRNGNAVAIVGSGLSCAAGAPTWQSMLLQLIAEAERTQKSAITEIANAAEMIRQGRFLDAASLLKSVFGSDFQNEVVRELQRNCYLSSDSLDSDAIGHALQGRSVRTLFKPNIAARLESLPIEPTRSHQILAQLGFRAVVTTNYDTLIEDAWPKPAPAVYSWSHDWAPAVQRGAQVILKLHGDINNRGDLVLAREDYSREIFAGASRRALYGLFSQRVLFWIGYGHNDPDLDLVLDECSKIPGLTGGFGLVLSTDVATRNRLGKVSVTPSVIQDHRHVETYLLKLAEMAERRLAYRILLSVPWTTEVDASRLVQKLLDEINERYNTSIALRGVMPGSIRAELVVPVKDFLTIEMLAQNRDPRFIEILNRYFVSEWTGFTKALHSLSLFSKEDFVAEMPVGVLAGEGKARGGRRLYVGNLSYSTTEADLRDAFLATGHDVAEVKVVLDRDTGRPRGFAFVEMGTDEAALKAIDSLNGKELNGRAIAVSEARERTGGFGSRGGRRGRW